MKTLVRQLLAMATTLALVHADDMMLPPKDLRADWTELRKLKFSEWGIKSFLGWDVPFDGGSKVFFFESDEGERFDLVAANPGYWTAQDKEESRQVFLVIHKNRFYRIDPKSDEEKNMIQSSPKQQGSFQAKARRTPSC